MKQEKYIFVDRDGTLIHEPGDEQVDTIEKLDFMPGVFSALLQLIQCGYRLVMVSNQDGLGSDSFPTSTFEPPHQLMLKIFRSQGIEFEDILICPHFSDEGCGCRKPEVGLLLDYLIAQKIDKANSYVIGDRETDLGLAQKLGVEGLKFSSDSLRSWQNIVDVIINKPRCAALIRQTKETTVSVDLNLDRCGEVSIKTGIGFFDHMLEQIAQHAGISLTVNIDGDLDIDDHHVIEDCGIVLGAALRSALGDKLGIARYGFVLPMDEARSTVTLDLSGRGYCKFLVNFSRERVGTMSTEMVEHFFKSFSDSLRASLHIEVLGENDHHKIEAAFKAVGRTLKQAISKKVSDSGAVPSTKGVL